VLIPVGIYALSYVAYMGSPGYESVKDIIDNQLGMFNYHSQLESTHPYGSPWWKWPILGRPVFYYSKVFEDGLKAGISAFGNPAVWWTGIVALVYTLYGIIQKKDKTALFILVGYLAQYAPWILITRTTYMYHYFPAVPFAIFMITYMFEKYVARKNEKLIYIYLGLVILLFIMFFPVLSGMPVSENYVDIFLRWLPGWQLII
jgi:dolichyl-phosphate-mannose--protein O-mannosyl transferase